MALNRPVSGANLKETLDRLSSGLCERVKARLAQVEHGMVIHTRLLAELSNIVVVCDIIHEVVFGKTHADKRTTCCTVPHNGTCVCFAVSSLAADAMGITTVRR